MKWLLLISSTIFTPNKYIKCSITKYKTYTYLTLACVREFWWPFLITCDVMSLSLHYCYGMYVCVRGVGGYKTDKKYSVICFEVLLSILGILLLL